VGAATPHPSDMMFQLAAGDKRMRAVAGHKEQVGHRDTAAAARRMTSERALQLMQQSSQSNRQGAAAMGAMIPR
jgi:hypothetical protein